jgi:hypothetical protein
MGNENIEENLTPGKVARLLRIGPGPAEAEPIPPETIKAELLRDRLANRLPAEGLARRRLLARLDDLREEILSSTDQSIEQCLFASDTPIETLTRIKDYGAVLSRSAQCEAEQETANVIYYGAIAAALIFQARRITDFKLADLERAFATLSGVSWLPANLAGHFRQAMDCCRRLSPHAEMAQ